jgi:hypothetical protein
VVGMASALHVLGSCQCAAHLSNRAGSLPPTWGDSGGFGALQNLLVEGNQLTGSLPGTWGSAGRFGALSRLDVSDNQLQGSIPTAWGGSALPSLTAL